MANALALNGAQPQKSTPFGAMYTGRMFTGLWTNRSPLRDAASTRIEEKFYGPRGDAMIAGSNVEVSNRLTLIRRPGNPIYDNTNTWSNVLSFDEFRINKGLSDVFGTTIEQIDLMVDQSDALYAVNGTNTRELVFTKSTGAGQSYMKQVANELYFGNGIDNKKWLQSLFMRDSGNNSTAINTNSYPFMDTFLIDPNNNIQQMIGTKVSDVSNVAITDNVLTLTVSDLGADYDVGAQFMLWNFSNVNTKFLNGATITLSVAYTSGGTTLTAPWIHADMSQADTAYVQLDSGGSPVTGGSVPVWGTTTPSASNFFNGSVTLDGNVIWINRGSPTENWGLAAPDKPLLFTATGSATGWAAHTYYSPASVYIDNVSGYLWQITSAGKTGSTQPVWPAAPTVSKKFDITKVAIAANVVTFDAVNTLSATNVVDIEALSLATFLNGEQLTVASASGTQFTANFTHANYTAAADQGYANLPGDTQSDGAAVWTAIQTPASLTWASHMHYHENDYVVAPVGTTTQLFLLRKNTQPFISNILPTVPGGFTPPTNPVTAYGWNGNPSFAGQFDKAYPQASADFTIADAKSTYWDGLAASPFTVNMYAVNGAGEVGATTSTGHNEEWEAAIVCNLFIPAPGTYTFTLNHDDGAYFSFDQSTGAFRVIGTGTNILAPGKTVVQGYDNCTGNNVSGSNTDSGTWSFPTAGNYGLEINWKNWEHRGTMIFTCNGQNIATTPDESGTNQPAWPPFTTTGASWDTDLLEINFGATVQESAKQYTWSNLGPISAGGTTGDFIWNANTDYTLPGTQIVDTNSNEEGAYETGISGASAPVWQTAINAITPESGSTLQWINEGTVPIQPDVVGKITATSAQGWIYAIALVNTLDNTVSNIGPLSLGTGPVISGHVTFAPGAGLPTDLTLIDTQADYVAIFRTTDGFSTELLIPSNGNTFYTVPLTQYLQYGYVDTTPDTALDTLVQAAAAGENTPPLPGAVNLTYHLNRIWYSIGSVVYYTTGPLAPVGNGINGTAPLNIDGMTSIVKRLVPTAIGLLVFTVSDIYIIPNAGGAILPALPYVPGVGISNYNALDQNGPTIGFFTTDRQFILFSPSAGGDEASTPIADQLSINTNVAPTAYNPKTAYVAHHSSGQDKGWFLADGVNGWFRLVATPSPETGQNWSPFATIQGGVRAIKSIEVSPGNHLLLLGPTGTGKINARNLLSSSDGGTGLTNGSTYVAYAVLGSYVLAQPGEIAQIAFVTTDSVNVGSPLILGVLIDEALPYFNGSFEMLKNWTNDPPGLPASKSILGQRFYFSELPDSSAACRHCQIMIQWPAESALNELNSFTLNGNFIPEL